MIIEILGFVAVLVIGGIIIWKFFFSVEVRHLEDCQQQLIEMKSLTKTLNQKSIYANKAKHDLRGQSNTIPSQIKNEISINIEQPCDQQQQQFANKNNSYQGTIKNIEPTTVSVTNKYQNVEEQQQQKFQKTQNKTSYKREEQKSEQKTYQQTHQVTSQLKEEQKQQQQSYQQTLQIPKQFTEKQKQQYQSVEIVNQQPKQNAISSTIKKNTKNIQPQQIQITLQQILKINKPIIFLIGQQGVGKTQIFNDICQYKKLEKKTIQDNFSLIEFDNFFLIDTPKFELNDDIDTREETIKQFSPIFNDLWEQITAFVIVCKFERTDIMKKNIMDSYKFLSKQKNHISLLIIDFHLSENKQDDMRELNERFSIFQSKIGKSKNQIMYYDKSIQNFDEKFQKIIEQFELLSTGRLSQRFSDTIFENIQSEEFEIEMQNIQNQIIQNFQNLNNSQGIQIY